jgi:hypothetical protein
MELIGLILGAVWLLGIISRSDPQFSQNLKAAGDAAAARRAARWEQWKTDAARRRAIRRNRRAEQRARELANAKLQQVERQMARGSAGDATQEEAREALHGRGGGANPLDDRWF